MKIGFIGAGKVGSTLGKFFTVRHIDVVGYYSKTKNSSLVAADFTKTKSYDSLETLLEDSDVLFLTVPDEEITNVYNELKKFNIKDKEIIHTSGSLSAKEAFPNIKEIGAYGLSIHPLFPVADKFNAYKEIGEAFFSIEGDDKVLKFWQEFLTKLGLKTQIISSEAKIRYHAAASLVSNSVCALMQMGLELMKDCGFSEKNAILALKPLIESNISHIISAGPIASLTGPVERGDTTTVRGHLESLNTGINREIYRNLALKLVDMANIKRPDKDFSNLEKMLQGGI